MGIAYDNEKFFFNAIQSYEISLSKEDHLLKGLNNIAVTLIQVGIQKEALLKLDRSISYYEKGRIEKDKAPELDYYNRAKLLRMLGKENEMQNDIQKAFQLKPNFVNCWLELAELNVQKGEFDKAEEAYSMAINVEQLKVYTWTARAKFYQLFGQYEKAISDFLTANRISTKKTITLYNLGMTYHLSGNLQKANDCYAQCLKKGEIFPPYDEASFQYGIVLFADETRGFGFILGKTIFNDYDKIYFNLSDAFGTPIKGSRVKFKCSYQMHKMQFTASAKCVSTDNTINDIRFKKSKVYHGIISIKQNAFKTSDDCKYIELFYPYRTFLPYSLVENKLDNEIISQLNRIGYSFVEMVVNISETNTVSLDYIKSIKSNNTYSNKIVSKRKTNRNYDSGRMCYVCGMDTWCGTDGCPWDPT